MSVWTGIIAGMTNAVLDLVLPSRCVGCRAGGSAWCAPCRGDLGLPTRVPGPSRLVRAPVYAIALHRGAAREAVVAYKERNRRDLAEEIAARFTEALIRLALPGPLCLVPAPSARAIARRRGGAHMSRIARRCGTQLAAAGHEVGVAEPFLFGRGVRDSVGLNTPSRLANVSAHLKVRSGALGRTTAGVVLLDDVVTTGATLGACAKALRTQGIRPIAALTLTRAAGRSR